MATAFVFSGGGTLGAVQVGMLLALTDRGVVATEVTTGYEVVLSRGSVVDAVLASAALPGMLPPVDVEGHLLMDGGVVNNSPISVAADLGADRVIVLPTGYACALTEPPKSALGMALHAVTVTIQRRLIA